MAHINQPNTEDRHDNNISLGAVDLYWIPLGAGKHVVKASGAMYETFMSFRDHRAKTNLYHSALAVNTPRGRYFIEQTPVNDNHGAERGVVGEGPVFSKWLRRSRLFRYEVRCWKNGIIPDLKWAVESPVRLSDDLAQSENILRLLPDVPFPVWGRDELKTGEMWNSNSVISWILVKSGVDINSTHPPHGGRAPGWNAGVVRASHEDG